MRTGRGLEDLANTLFATTEELADPDITPEDLEAVIRRSKALIPAAKGIIEISGLMLDAAKFSQDHHDHHGAPALPSVFTGNKEPLALTQQAQARAPHGGRGTTAHKQGRARKP